MPLPPPVSFWDAVSVALAFVQKVVTQRPGAVGGSGAPQTQVSREGAPRAQCPGFPPGGAAGPSLEAGPAAGSRGTRLLRASAG